VTELEYVLKHGGLTPKRLLQRITRRGFGVSVLGGLMGAAASRLLTSPPVAVASRLMSAPSPTAADFTIAIIPDPQYLAESCPDKSGKFYAAMMNWIAENRDLVLTSSSPSFHANIKAVVGVGDCVNSADPTEFNNAANAWTILDTHGIAFTTPPGNHDYADAGDVSSRHSLGAQFKKGYFSAKQRASVYGSGIRMGDGDMAYWIGSHDSTGANTAVKFVISGIRLLVLAMDFFAGNAAWSWAYDVMAANSDCECYITTHAWLTMQGMQYERMGGYGPDSYAMAGPPYSNSAAEAWGARGINTWPNLCGIFSGHDIFPGTSAPGWYWQQVPVKSISSRQQTVHQLFANSQPLDNACSVSASRASGAGQLASVFLLSRRPALGLLEGRMISTHTGNWFQSRAASFPTGESWSESETLLFSVPFTGLGKEQTPGATRLH
jgi:hypothetical protein